MDCPSCGRPTKQTNEGGEVNFHCPYCGWGAESEDGGDEAAAAEMFETPGAADWVKVGFLWVLSALIVGGPFFALWYGVPELFDIGIGGAEGAVDRWHNALLTHYWWVMLVYLILAAAVTLSYDRDNLGLFGSPFLDNPLSWTDDYNRSMRTLFFLLAPGKLVYMTCVFTFRTLRASRGA